MSGLNSYLKGIISYEGVSRIETYPYPREAIREAVLNAIAHKNYAALIPIQIQVFSDKMIISNDSVLPEGWTMEDLLGKHRSCPYNPLIANAFYRAGFIESWGRGIMKIREACKIAGNKEPVYNIKTNELTVVFEAKEVFGTETPLIEGSNCEGNDGNCEGNDGNLSENESAVYRMLTENPSISAKDISEKLKISKSTVERAEAALKEKGYIIRQGRTRGKWLIVSARN